MWERTQARESGYVQSYSLECSFIHGNENIFPALTNTAEKALRKEYSAMHFLIARLCIFRVLRRVKKHRYKIWWERAPSVYNLWHKRRIYGKFTSRCSSIYNKENNKKGNAFSSCIEKMNENCLVIWISISRALFIEKLFV